MEWYPRQLTVGRLMALVANGAEATAIRTMIRALGDISLPVRRAAAEAVGNLLGNDFADQIEREAIPALRKLTDDPEPTLRVKATRVGGVEPSRSHQPDRQ